MRILDLFCGAGLVADGLIAAGCEVIGVDIAPQPNFPGPFIQHDALTLDDRLLTWADAIWASPPCLRDTAMKSAPGAKGDAHPDLITPTRAMLRRIGRPFVIENVMRARLADPVVLCGSMFGLATVDDGTAFHLERHRKFETNWPLAAPCPCKHRKPVVGCYGSHARVRAASAGGRGTRDPWTRPHREIMAEAMGVRRPVLTAAEISQGIPPVYAEYVATQLRGHLLAARAAA
ncbi:hypothetical protein [Phenylobacterium sp.]|uniref:hypothetical protein n=1 Tax=Phenylobacterium sp. TaxID=1871053 RepID=UPI002737C6E4|nr:hypothetical protein [Phenylobacterium sp.]MDP3869163.1 hypothetical protein [Phenylobacterium sp.]